MSRSRKLHNPLTSMEEAIKPMNKSSDVGPRRRPPGRVADNRSSRGTPCAGFSSLLLTLTASMILTGTAKAQSDCPELLRDGIFDTVAERNAGFSHTMFHDALCDESLKIEQRDQSGGGGGGVSFAGFKLGGTYEQAQSFRQRYQQKYCRGTAGLSVTAHDEDLLQRVANRDLTNAFVKCKELERKGLRVHSDLRADQGFIQFNVVYDEDPGVRGNPQIEGVQVSPEGGALCTTQDFTAGLPLERKSYSVTCKRETSEWLSIVLKTSVGNFTKHLVSIPGTTDLPQLSRDLRQLEIKQQEQERELDRLTAELVSSQLLVLDGSVEGIGSDERRVDFPAEFRDRPIVSSGFIFLDAGPPHQNVRISFEITAIDTKGFRYKMNTWAGTEIHGVKVRWTAVGVRK